MGKTTILKPALPQSLAASAGCRGSNQIAFGHAQNTRHPSQIRSSPVYAGYAIKPLEKLQISPQAPAVSDRIGVIRQAGRPLSRMTRQKATKRFPSLRAIRKDILKGMISYSSSIRNASTGVPAEASTSRTCSLARPLPLAKSKIHTSLTRPFVGRIRRLSRGPYRMRQRLAFKIRGQIRNHAVLHGLMRLERVAADMGVSTTFGSEVSSPGGFGSLA